MTTFPAKSVRYARQFTKGRKVELQTTSKPIPLWDNYWDGGTKSDYYLLKLETGEYERLPDHPAPWKAEQEPVIPAVGYCIVRLPTFCGKKCDPVFLVYDYGEPSLGPVLLAYLTGDLPWEWVEDKLRDCSLLT